MSCDSAVYEAFHWAKQRCGAPRLNDELHAQGYRFNVKTVAASLLWSGAEWESVTEAQSGQLPRTWPAGVGKTAETGFLRRRPEPEVVG